MEDEERRAPAYWQCSDCGEQFRTADYGNNPRSARGKALQHSIQSNHRILGAFDAAGTLIAQGLATSSLLGFETYKKRGRNQNQGQSTQTDPPQEEEGFEEDRELRNRNGNGKTPRSMLRGRGLGFYLDLDAPALINLHARHGADDYPPKSDYSHISDMLWDILAHYERIHSVPWEVVRTYYDRHPMEWLVLPYVGFSEGRGSNEASNSEFRGYGSSGDRVDGEGEHSPGQREPGGGGLGGGEGPAGARYRGHFHEWHPGGDG